MLAIAVFYAPPTLARQTIVGQKAPDFRLETLKGQQVGREALKGKPTVVVVGRERASAPPCKDWIVSLDRKLGGEVAFYQLIVTLKPWYLPKFLVRKKIAQLVPSEYHRHVLIEWRDRFAKQFSIPKDNQPTVLLFGADGTLLWRHRGRIDEKSWSQLEAALPGKAMLSLR